MKVPSRKVGMLLDVGCKDRKQAHWFGIDSRQYPGVDLIHDPATFPYPFPDESCLTIKAAHVLEHVAPQLFFHFMDEMWRLLKPEGQIAISAPYAGSPGYWQDPTHVLALTEKSWQYLDPDCPTYTDYHPRPWKIEPGFPVWQVGGNLEVVLRKRGDQSTGMMVGGRAMNLGAFQKLSELAAFLDLVKDRHLRTVVEIGTARGGVLYALCQIAAPDALIVSIDLPGGPFGGGHSLRDQEKLATYGKVGQRMGFLRCDSHAASTKQALLKMLGNQKIDLLFIDGDHTYAGVKKDFTMYAPLVAKGGVIAFHDISLHQNQPEVEVERFWKELKKKYPGRTQECMDFRFADWGGIGVLTWP